MGQARKVVVATHNEGKLGELRRILDGFLADEGQRIELVSALVSPVYLRWRTTRGWSLM